MFLVEHGFWVRKITFITIAVSRTYFVYLPNKNKLEFMPGIIIVKSLLPTVKCFDDDSLKKLRILYLTLLALSNDH